MDLLKTLESGLILDNNLADNILELKAQKSKNMKEMLRMCVNDGAYEFISLNTGRIKAMLRSHNR